jgi:hypothetical protein
MGDVHIWSIRSTDGGATGLEFAQARIAPTDTVLVHATPSRIDVGVYENGGTLVAIGEGLDATGETPISRLRVDGLRILREEIWPSDEDLGTVVILPGGEAGVLTRWWNAEDRSAWRWSLELSNRVRG